MAAKKPKTNSDQLHGALDMLVLKVLAGGPLHGYAIAVRLEGLRTRSSPSKRARSIPPSTAWSRAVGSRPSGR